MEEYTLAQGLAAVGFGNYQGLVLAYAGLGWVADAMEIMILSFVGPAVKSDWGLSSGEESFLTTAVFAGMLVGAYTWGTMSDVYGRRRGLFGVALISSGAGFLSAFSPNYISLVFLRSLVGFGLGGGHVFSSWFLEFVPASNRGMWMVIFSTFWTFGTIFEAGLAWIVMPRLNWRWLLALSSLPSFAVLLFYSVAPESPMYLCMKGRTSDAHDVLEKIALLNQRKLPSGVLISCSSTKLNGETEPLKDALLLPTVRNKTLEVKPGSLSIFMLFSSKFMKTTFILWILFFGNAFSYYGVILLTSELSSKQSKCISTTLLSEISEASNLYLNVFITSLAEIPGLILSAILVDRVGRKVSMSVMFILGSHFLVPLVSHQSDTLTTGSLFGARICFLGSYTVACIYAPEIYPTTVRSTGAGVATAVGRIGGMICPLVSVGLVTGCHQTAAIVIMVLMMLLSALCALLLPIETNGQNLS